MRDCTECDKEWRRALLVVLLGERCLELGHDVGDGVGGGILAVKLAVDACFKTGQAKLQQKKGVRNPEKKQVEKKQVEEKLTAKPAAV